MFYHLCLVIPVFLIFCKKCDACGKHSCPCSSGGNALVCFKSVVISCIEVLYSVGCSDTRHRGAGDSFILLLPLFLFYVRYCAGPLLSYLLFEYACFFFVCFLPSFVPT
ncbi:hypothetical protein, unlikely [Trypanosoma brucei gambiense DAL972]|uniref:T. brucei spp.-specific protein n=1 Tax=Trypanosoma brucei gambiense (strain MHOM/CI/86/DAL972) TaxID=679716 RepID=C9ZS07_TRYB9|nr:hypothetical protein, unlikely [Trypanosoma brucei gambiense DAL972]CBH12143.1 hypothetical protein, unlikely [Trypanosoma brucei gambiense DAL972]|eukprot:XP_011774426.1 hypothetical protein, unlikely [Trypanosoma brucei gambiense DAL972]